MIRSVGIAALCVWAISAWGCQRYEVVFQPDTQREGTHLRFSVEQPSKADILFVIDNSRGMREKQEALKASLTEMLDFLAPRDASYRIGITSTDANGFEQDCCGADIPLSGPDDLGGNQGACKTCDCVIADPSLECIDCGTCAPRVTLRRPHDGARGRLVAAYDPEVFDVNAVDGQGNELYPLSPELKTILGTSFPTGLETGPTGVAGDQGARWVIDREAVRAEACAACGCDPCGDSEDDDVECFQTCAAPIAQSLVTAYFNANVNGLGTSGWGWEEGLEAGLLAVGIRPEDSNDTTAIDPGSGLNDPSILGQPGGPNSFMVNDPVLGTVSSSWIREDALLAIMFVTDEEDCSMPGYLMGLSSLFESNLGQPAGSMCYQPDAQSQFLNPQRMAQLLLDLKQSPSRVVVGLIAGTENGGVTTLTGGREAILRRNGTATDCQLSAVAPDTQPNTECSCLNGEFEQPDDAVAWCSYTSDTSGTGPACDGLAANRYVEFAKQFNRRTFDSVCRSSTQAFGDALEDFARLATLACFRLEDVRPARDNADLITVERTPKALVDQGVPPQRLVQTSEDALEIPEDGGWFYDPVENQVCLLGIDRLLDDVYDIFVLHVDEQEFGR